MLRRSKKAETEAANATKELFKKGGDAALREKAKLSAEKLWEGEHWIYKSKEQMEQGFYQELLDELNK